MKNRFILLLILSSIAVTGLAQQEKVQWYSFQKAVQLNKENPKKILIDVYTDWCGWCEKMKKTTFNHPDIARYINKNFYPVRFDAETNKKVQFKGRTFTRKDESGRNPHELAAALLKGKMSYPSVAYLDEKNQLITAVPGYYGPKKMEPILKFFANDIYKKKSFKAYKKNFEPTLVDRSGD